VDVALENRAIADVGFFLAPVIVLIAREWEKRSRGEEGKKNV
jgi:hypothetical protein